MKYALATAGLLCLCTFAAAHEPDPYPLARKSDQQDLYFGQRVADPYRWLEDDNSAQTKAWVKAENAVTQKYLSAVPQREPVKKLFTELYNYEKFGLPRKEGNRYFWTRNDGLQQQAVLYMASSLEGKPSVAIDPNTLSKDGTVALSGIQASRDGRYLAYGVAAAGSDWETWQVRDLDSGRDLPDRVEWVKDSETAWTVDGLGFFYARYDAPKPGAALTGANYFHKVYYHRLGQPQSADTLVYENKEQKEWAFAPAVSDDGSTLLIDVELGAADKNGLLALALPHGAYAGGQPRPVTLAMDAKYELIAATSDRIFIRTDKNAPRGRIVAVDLRELGASPTEWKTLVPEGPDALTAASLVGGRLILQYLHDASTLVRVQALDGSTASEVALPGVGTASGFGGRSSDPETFFSYTSLTAPPELWRYDVASGKATLFKRPATAFNAEEFETERQFVTSKDGTRVPIFIAHKKGVKLDGNNPTLLYAYGGFDISMTPSYNVTAATWMKMGGIYVLASLRGGGEYGAAWHEAGTKLNKQNVFDDFIATAEWLIANKYTSPARLAINGGSNGGLLIGAVVNQRPELFGVAIPQVGVMDMLRYNKFTIGWSWAGDFGTAQDSPEQFKALLAYSPLHTIRSHRNYPALLATTADHDDRVVPAHTFKYMATLQATDTGGAPKLVRIETNAGHGAGKPTSKIIDERSDMLAFIAHIFHMQIQ